MLCSSHKRTRSLSSPWKDLPSDFYKSRGLPFTSMHEGNLSDSLCGILDYQKHKLGGLGGQWEPWWLAPRAPPMTQRSGTITRRPYIWKDLCCVLCHWAPSFCPLLSLLRGLCAAATPESSRQGFHPQGFSGESFRSQALTADRRQVCVKSQLLFIPVASPGGICPPACLPHGPVCW